MQIKELKTAKEFEAVYPIIRQLNPSMTLSQYKAYLKPMLAQGYRCIAAVENGKYLGVTGIWTGTRFWCGRYVDMDNVAVDEEARGKGIGARMAAWVEKEAKRLNADIVVLDSYTGNHGSHRFYHREGYSILGYHFVKWLKPPADAMKRTQNISCGSGKPTRKRA